jgi:DNA-binding NarL/FixJ family response regulator
MTNQHNECLDERADVDHVGQVGAHEQQQKDWQQQHLQDQQQRGGREQVAVGAAGDAAEHDDVVHARGEQHQQHPDPAAPGVLEPPGSPTVLVSEHFIERELIVLRYLPTMLKAGEIAKDLYVTVNTVKSHLRAIYRELDVTPRRDAVERVRALNLI